MKTAAVQEERGVLERKPLVVGCANNDGDAEAAVLLARALPA